MSSSRHIKQTPRRSRISAESSGFRDFNELLDESDVLRGISYNERIQDEFYNSRPNNSRPNILLTQTRGRNSPPGSFSHINSPTPKSFQSFDSSSNSENRLFSDFYSPQSSCFYSPLTCRSNDPSLAE